MIYLALFSPSASENVIYDIEVETTTPPEVITIDDSDDECLLSSHTIQPLETSVAKLAVHHNAASQPSVEHQFISDQGKFWFYELKSYL